MRIVSILILLATFYPSFNVQAFSSDSCMVCGDRIACGDLNRLVNLKGTRMPLTKYCMAKATSNPKLVAFKDKILTEKGAIVPIFNSNSYEEEIKAIEAESLGTAENVILPIGSSTEPIDSTVLDNQVASRLPASREENSSTIPTRWLSPSTPGHIDPLKVSSSESPKASVQRPPLRPTGSGLIDDCLRHQNVTDQERCFSRNRLPASDPVVNAPQDSEPDDINPVVETNPVLTPPPTNTRPETERIPNSARQSPTLLPLSLPETSPTSASPATVVKKPTPSLPSAVTPKPITNKLALNRLQEVKVTAKRLPMSLSQINRINTQIPKTKEYILFGPAGSYTVVQKDTAGNTLCKNIEDWEEKTFLLMSREDLKLDADSGLSTEQMCHQNFNCSQQSRVEPVVESNKPLGLSQSPNQSLALTGSSSSDKRKTCEEHYKSYKNQSITNEKCADIANISLVNKCNEIFADIGYDPDSSLGECKSKLEVFLHQDGIKDFFHNATVLDLISSFMCEGLENGPSKDGCIRDRDRAYGLLNEDKSCPLIYEYITLRKFKNGKDQEKSKAYEKLETQLRSEDHFWFYALEKKVQMYTHELEGFDFGIDTLTENEKKPQACKEKMAKDIQKIKDNYNEAVIKASKNRFLFFQSNYAKACEKTKCKILSEDDIKQLQSNSKQKALALKKLRSVVDLHRRLENYSHVETKYCKDPSTKEEDSSEGLN